MWWSSLFSLPLSDDKISFVISELLKSSMLSYLHSFAAHVVLLIFEAAKATRRFWLAYYNSWFFPTSLIDEGNSYPVFYFFPPLYCEVRRLSKGSSGRARKKSRSCRHSKYSLVPYPVTKFFILLCYASIVSWATLADSPQTVGTFILWWALNHWSQSLDALNWKFSGCTNQMGLLEHCVWYENVSFPIKTVPFVNSIINVRKLSFSIPLHVFTYILFILILLSFQNRLDLCSATMQVPSFEWLFWFLITLTHCSKSILFKAC